MNYNKLLTILSVISLVLLTFHLADDIGRGMAPGGLTNVTALVVVVVWVYGALVFAQRRAGYILLLLGGIAAAGMPVIHMRGVGVGPMSTRSNGFFFIWTLLALGITGMTSILLAARALWATRAAAAR